MLRMCSARWAKNCLSLRNPHLKYLLEVSKEINACQSRGDLSQHIWCNFAVSLQRPLIWHTVFVEMVSQELKMRKKNCSRSTHLVAATGVSNFHFVILELYDVIVLKDCFNICQFVVVF